MKIKFFFLFFFLFLLTDNANAAGLAATPAYLDVHIDSENDLLKKIYVINNSEKKSDYLVYSDSNAITPFPNAFSLEKEKTSEVAIQLDLGKIKGNFKATLFIVSNDSGKTDVRAGIKIPVSVSVENTEILKNATEKAAETGQNSREGNELSEKLNETANPTGLFFLAANPTVLSGIILALLAVIILIYILHAKKTKHNKENQ
ncbi:MAG: hypothetical protein J7K00_01525 [Candidatus Diapherotrites archaeon]|nr:hypothetical protein [Candidatus Diapherotrites archaeon]